MVFNQVLSITSESSVPDNKVWKVESVLKFDGNFESNISDSDDIDDESIISKINGIPIVLNGSGQYSPDSLKYWVVDIILEQENSQTNFTLNYNNCGHANYPPDWVCYYSNDNLVLVSFGGIHFSVTPQNTTYTLGSMQYCNCDCSECPDTLLSNYNLSNEIFQNINFPIFINHSEMIDVIIDGIIINLKEYTVE